ncbi:MAG: hypothetical protein ACJAUZ_002991, partial [Flavobacteriaceae bacterium]
AVAQISNKQQQSIRGSMHCTWSDGIEKFLARFDQLSV